METDRIICGDALEELPAIPEDSIDAIVTDPPYELAFMGKKWDGTGIAYNKDMWAGCLRVLKPGGHLLAFGGTRTYHRMVVAIEDAGFEIRDSIHWVYGSGFPKSLDISKSLDKTAGAERAQGEPKTDVTGRKRALEPSKGNSNGFHGALNVNRYEELPVTTAAKQWAGYGTALKPAHEPIVLARKPLEEGTIAANVLRWGTGGINIDACRVAANDFSPKERLGATKLMEERPWNRGQLESGERKTIVEGNSLGRFPANLIWSHSPNCQRIGKSWDCAPDCPSWEFAKAGERKSGGADRISGKSNTSPSGWKSTNRTEFKRDPDTGSAARFFKSCQFTEEDIPAFIYQAKASRSERTGSDHPTMKPLTLMRYLCRLICPPNGIILDPFTGSGTTCLAAKREGFGYIGIEKEAEYVEIARRRIAALPARLDSFI